MAVNTSFYGNMVLLMQMITPSEELKKHFREGMFEKPNTVGFIHVSQYLLTIYDAERFKKLVQWPITCKRTEAKFRNDVRDYISIIVTENSDINFPSILTSYLIRANGTMFMFIMWKLSIVVLRTYIRKHCGKSVLYAPKPGCMENLAKQNLQVMKKRISNDIMSHHNNMIKIEEMSTIIAKQEEESLAKTKQKLFEIKQFLNDLAIEAPVHEAIKSNLTNVEDTEIIDMWKQSLTEKLKCLQKKQASFEDIESLSNKIIGIISSRITDVVVLDGHQLTKVSSAAIQKLSPSENMQCPIHHLYSNDKLVLSNLIQLFHLLLKQLYQELKINKLKDLSNCRLKIERRNESIKEAFHLFESAVENITTLTEDITLNPHKRNIDQLYDEDAISLKNNIFIPSPVIRINTTSENEWNDMRKRLELTPVEGTHKLLFSRYKRNRTENTDNSFYLSQLRTNLLISRINFDDTISSNTSDKCMQSQEGSLSKICNISMKPIEKYSRLFRSPAKKRNPRGNKDNFNVTSISYTAKANSTAITNMTEETDNAPQFNLRNSSKSLDDFNKEITPSIRLIPKKSTSVSEQRLENTFESNENICNQQSNQSNQSEQKCEPGTKVNNESTVEEVKAARNKRFSISDLVQRYKEVLKISNNTKIDPEIDDKE